ncbi:histone-lysine N-methyltransferase SETMAR [Plakobranchus ocellatus]|uniref:Histone-lysine N-methyltransferase SETMAR n=1 Tax=Plakobranchus ocellatus TaxID=259542 RepID=A0AAV3Y1U5_9GAST|nr:histone-lysine N-methyltransferase SETMAR [Plakobranchus ocellatus]
MINLAIAKFLPDGSPKCCQMSISARESKSPKSCCTGVKKKDETADVGPGRDHCARNKLLEYLITGDETWLHLSTPETKRDSMTWKHPSSHVTKKFKVQQSTTKVMATVFWDSCGMILLDILAKGESVNVDRYCETLDWLRHAVPSKRPGLLRSGVVLQQDNATHTQQNAQRNGLNVTGGTLFPIQPTVQTLHPQTFIYLGP